MITSLPPRRFCTTHAKPLNPGDMVEIFVPYSAVQYRKMGRVGAWRGTRIRRWEALIVRWRFGQGKRLRGRASVGKGAARSDSIKMQGPPNIVLKNTMILIYVNKLL